MRTTECVPTSPHRNPPPGEHGHEVTDERDGKTMRPAAGPITDIGFLRLHRAASAGRIGQSAYGMSVVELGGGEPRKPGRPGSRAHLAVVPTTVLLRAWKCGDNRNPQWYGNSDGQS